MERRYFRANKLMESPAAAGGNPMEGDLMLQWLELTETSSWFINKKGNWQAILDEDLPNELKVLLLIGAI